MPLMPPVPFLYPFKFTYNMVQVMLCSYMCIEAGVRAYMAGYSCLPCNAFDFKNPPITFILYVFYLSKILDFFDTFFIIAEKRWKQLSFLHVYHHTSIFLVLPFPLLTVVMHSLTYTCLCNCLVLLAEYQCRLWWRRVSDDRAQRLHPHSNVHVLLCVATQ